MESVELEVAPEGETVTQALQRLKDSGTGGTVVKGVAGACVLTLDDLLGALRSHGDVALTQVQPGGAGFDAGPENAEAPEPDAQEIQEQVASPEDPDWAAGGASRGGSWGGEQFIRPAPLATTPTITITGQVAVVSGLDARQVSSLRATVTLWKCTIDPRHIYKKDELARQGRCNVDGARVVLL